MIVARLLHPRRLPSTLFGDDGPKGPIFEKVLARVKRVVVVIFGSLVLSLVGLILSIWQVYIGGVDAANLQRQIADRDAQSAWDRNVSDEARKRMALLGEQSEAARVLLRSMNQLAARHRPLENLASELRSGQKTINADVLDGLVKDARDAVGRIVPSARESELVDVLRRMQAVLNELYPRLEEKTITGFVTPARESLANMANYVKAIETVTAMKASESPTYQEYESAVAEALRQLGAIERPIESPRQQRIAVGGALRAVGTALEHASIVMTYLVQEYTGKLAKRYDEEMEEVRKKRGNAK